MGRNGALSPPAMPNATDANPDASPTRSFAHPNLVVTTTSKSASINTRNSDGASNTSHPTCPADGPSRSRRKEDVSDRDTTSERRIGAF